MPNSKFLEEYSLYRKLQLNSKNTLDRIEKPNINMTCNSCNGMRTFIMQNEYYAPYSYQNTPSDGKVVYCRYRCASCEEFERHFVVKISEKLDWVMKVGQFPAWDISGDRNIEGLLGNHKSLLKKGMISESQGYGIGAFSYYRRIVE